MFKIRSIPPTTEIDERKVYSNTNLPIETAFKTNDAWALFELHGRRKYAIALRNLIEHEYEDYEQHMNEFKLPNIPRSMYSRLKNFAEVNAMMRGH